METPESETDWKPKNQVPESSFKRKEDRTKNFEGYRPTIKETFKQTLLLILFKAVLIVKYTIANALASFPKSLLSGTYITKVLLFGHIR